jgi:hypothetical protein
MSVKVKCIKKNRDDKGRIVSYILSDAKGQTIAVTGQQIRNEMQLNRYEFINLQIDKAGRLVDKAEEPQEVKRITRDNRDRTLITKPDAVEHKLTSKEIVKDYLRKLNKIYGPYTEDTNNAYKFMYALNSNYDSNDNNRMPSEAKVYFQKLISDIKQKAVLSGCAIILPEHSELNKYNEKDLINYCNLPETVTKFAALTHCNYSIIVGLFNEAANEYLDCKGSGQALLRLRVIDGLDRSDGEYECITSNFNYAKKFIRKQLELYMTKKNIQSENELLASNTIELGINDKGRAFFLRYVAEKDNKDLEYYANEIFNIIAEQGLDSIYTIKDFLTNSYMQAKPDDYCYIMLKTYMALKHGILEPLEKDVYADIVDKEIYSIIRAYSHSLRQRA